MMNIARLEVQMIQNKDDVFTSAVAVEPRANKCNHFLWYEKFLSYNFCVHAGKIMNIVSRVKM